MDEVFGDENFVTADPVRNKNAAWRKGSQVIFDSMISVLLIRKDGAQSLDKFRSLLRCGEILDQPELADTVS